MPRLISADIKALPKPAAIIPPHCTADIDSSSITKAKSAANIGEDWVTGIVRETS